MVGDSMICAQISRMRTWRIYLFIDVRYSPFRHYVCFKLKATRTLYGLLFVCARSAL